MVRLPGETTIAWAVLDIEWYQAVYPDTRVITDPVWGSNEAPYQLRCLTTNLSDENGGWFVNFVPTGDRTLYEIGMDDFVWPIS